MSERKYCTDTFVTYSGLTIDVTYIKHASILFDMDGYIIYVDPVTKYGDSYEGWPKADAVLITHNHKDHFEPALIENLSKQTTVVLTSENDEVGRKMCHCEVLELKEGLTVMAVPAYNTTKGHLKFHPKERKDNGYVIEYDGFRIYVAGDTEVIPEMESLANIDLAFLPVNQPYTMTVEQCINAIDIIKPKQVVPYHFSETDVMPIYDRYQASGTIVRIRQMQ